MQYHNKSERKSGDKLLTEGVRSVYHSKCEIEGVDMCVVLRQDVK